MKISAIITTFNRAEMAKRAMESILAQTISDFELIILDNDSTDNTEEVIRSFADSRIRYIKHRPMGISAARNFGVKEARGEFVAFLDDDDEWLPEKLEKQIAVFDQADKGVGFVYCGFERVDKRGKPINSVVPSKKGNVFEYCLFNMDTLTGSASVPMMRKNAIEKAGMYDETVKTGEDYEMYLRLAQLFHFEIVPESLVRINQHEGYRLGGRLEDYLHTNLTVYKNFEDILDKNQRAKSRHLQVIAGHYFRLGRTQEGRKYILKALRSYPFNIFAWLQLVCSFLGRKFYLRAHRAYQSIVLKKR